jgi:hypothetical protein
LCGRDVWKLFFDTTRGFRNLINRLSAGEHQWLLKESCILENVFKEEKFNYFQSKLTCKIRDRYKVIDLKSYSIEEQN